DQYNVFMHQADMLSMPVVGVFEGFANNAFNTGGGIDGGFFGDLLLRSSAHGPTGANIESFGTSPKDHKIDIARIRQWRGRSRLEHRRPEIHRMVKREAQLQEDFAF